MREACDVVVVGAGPVGLLTAIELTLGGARVLVLERLAAVNPVIKALGVGPLGSEALERRGFAEAIAAEEERAVAAMGGNARSAGPGKRVAGHFAGLFLLQGDAQDEPERRMRMVPQQGLEVMLGAEAQALGVAVRRGREVVGLSQDAGGVSVDWASPDGAGDARCSWLVACDGGRSTVRRMAGFDFPGTEPTVTMYQALADVDGPVPSGWTRTPGGMYACGPFPRRLFMVDFSGPPPDRQAPVTREEVEAVLRGISGLDVRVTAMEVANRWTDNARLASSYRRGRVLLAGDAAHVHSPFGGQGLNLGLVDAANLGWKLAAVVRGDLPCDLLDSYGAERRPVAEAVLANTRAQIAIMRPDPQSGAMRTILAELMRFADVNRYFGSMVSGLATRYDLGDERDRVGRLVGDRRVALDGEECSLYALMRRGEGVLLDAGRGEATRAAAGYAVRRATVPDGPSLLIRPDGCVAWSRDDDATDGLDAALRRWFGPSRRGGRRAGGG